MAITYQLLTKANSKTPVVTHLTNLGNKNGFVLGLAMLSYCPHQSPTIPTAGLHARPHQPEDVVSSVLGWFLGTFWIVVIRALQFNSIPFQSYTMHWPNAATLLVHLHDWLPTMLYDPVKPRQQGVNGMVCVYLTSNVRCKWPG